MEKLIAIWNYLKDVNWRKFWLWVRESSGSSLLVLVGITNSKKLGELLPGVLPDVDLTGLINPLFWGKVAHWDAFVLVVALLASQWLNKPADAPTDPKAA